METRDIYATTVDEDVQGNVTYGPFNPYGAQPIRPSHIHRQKDAHMNPIDLLLDGFEQAVQTHPPPDNVLPF